MIRNDRYQISIAKKIVEAFQNGKKNVVLEAPTGSGKSGMAWFTHLFGSYTTCVLSHQKVLQDQYDELMNDGNPVNFLTLKGKSNYQCALNKKLSVEKAPCSHSKYACKYKKSGECEYWKLRKEAEKTSFLNMNYQQMYLLYDLEFEEEFKYKKDLYIFDECHNFKDIYKDIRTVRISSEELKFFKEFLDIVDRDGYTTLNHLIQDLIKKYKQIKFQLTQEDEKYGLDVFRDVASLKTSLSLELKDIIKNNEYDLIEQGKIAQYSSILDEIDRWRSSYYILLKYKEDIIENNNFVIEYSYEKNKDEEKKSSSLIPLDISNLFNKEVDGLAEKRLFMSSTIFGKKKFIKSLGLNDEETEYITLDSRFPLENRKILVCSLGKINKKAMENHEKMEKYFHLISCIALEHAKKNESGVIFSQSYGLSKQYIDSQYRVLKDNGIDIIYNLNSEDREKAIDKFTEKNDYPKLLISPSFYEGVNFKDDISRYQIIMKIPYASLGSKYVSELRKRDPLWYQLQAMTKVVQGVGRSIRSVSDYAMTYITDSNFSFLWSQCDGYVPKWFSDSVQFIKDMDDPEG